MNYEAEEILQKYFDGDLAEDQFERLQQLLKSDSSSIARFVENAFLHDRLRGVFQAQSALRQIPPLESCPDSLSENQRRNPSRRSPVSRRRLLISAAIAASVLFAFAIWRSGGEQALAGVSELQRVIAANSLEAIRVYSMDVEALETGSTKRQRAETEERRPVKPPLDRAVLYVRGKQDFVLIRKTLSGDDFITGCDSLLSWAIAPDGPVRVSDDLARFNRDVPGHEFAMPLCHLSDALERLHSVSDLALLPIEYSDGDSSDSEPRRLLVATKKKGQRGPRRVEITYFADSGLIESLRFVDMPYGPERITVRLSIMPTPSLPDDFFHHQNHHAPDREIERE